ncbi:hypothetical protein EDD11_000559 [Mortierella claussenii]|nr:hypothetical protein EDD11_000559 [Mortierella claussenii]
MMGSPSHPSSIINSPSLRKHRDLMSSRNGHSLQTRSSVPSTTPRKSPGAAYRRQFQQQPEQKQQFKEQPSLLYNAAQESAHSPADSNLDSQTTITIPPSFKVPTFLTRRANASSGIAAPPPPADSTSHPASSIHKRQATEMADSLAKLFEENIHPQSEASRQAQSSLSIARESLQTLRHSQQRTAESSTLTSRPTYPQLRTTETEYDVSPSKAAHLLRSPSASSLIATPSSRAHRRQKLSSVENLATIDWLQKTADAARVQEEEHTYPEDLIHGHRERLDQRYTHQTSTADHDDTYQLANANQHSQHDHYEPEVSLEQERCDTRRSNPSPARRRRSLSAADAYIHKENIPISSEDILLPLSFSALEARTPDSKQYREKEAEDSLLEVAESTTTITNQLRGVYTNLQEFFSPESEAKLNGAISVIGSQKQSRIAKGLSSSVTKPRPLDFRSASVRRDVKKPSTTFRSTRPLTEPVPFNFSERLNQIQKRHTTPRPSQTFNGRMSKSLRRPLREQSQVDQQQHQPVSEIGVEHDVGRQTLRKSTPVMQNRNVNEYQEMSKSPFIPLAQRKKQLEKNNLPATAETSKRPLTKPRSPVLQTRVRARSTSISHDGSVAHDVAYHEGYRAHKIDRRIFESSGDLGVPKISKPPLTVPKSPVFTKRRHAPLRPAIIPSKPPSQHYRGHQSGIQQQGLVSSAESARRLSHENMSRSTRHERSSGVSRTHCQTSRQPAAKPTLTVPEPFKLETESRGARYQEQFQHKLDKWKQIEKEQQFKALPLPVYPEQFIPRKSTRPVTHTEPVHLRTNQRAEEWEIFEQERRHKQKLLQDMLAEKAHEDEIREQQELKELRQRLVPHPEPIRDYPRIDIQKSTRPLTIPRSPNIGEKRKRQMTLDRELSGPAQEAPHAHRYDHDHDQYGIQNVDHASSSALQPRQHEPVYQEDPAQQERQREHERAQGLEFERGRLSAFSGMRGGSGGGEDDRQRQDRIRAEIERQREKDAMDRQQMQDRHQPQRYSQLYTNGVETDHIVEAEVGPSKRQRTVMQERSEPLYQYQHQHLHLYEQQEQQPLFNRPMGRKSWLEANDL